MGLSVAVFHAVVDATVGTRVILPSGSVPPGSSLSCEQEVTPNAVAAIRSNAARPRRMDNKLSFFIMIDISY
ncbi:hypothetical protein J8L13_15395 [Bacteroides fragilis]|uniref:hypothetical protein n=1 Tax=Bacteroides fragilis TaxID=817 RepID=UPI00202E6AD7|nr:hypothetical protein [Bacteroides fragilis]MCM0238774.1 hypothetical protein [Bacteroides fragilis]